MTGSSPVEGIWGAQTFLCTLLAGLVAMNFFEPLAHAIRGLVGENYADIVALLGLFTGLVFALRMGTEQLAPSYIQVIPMLDTIGKWGFGVITGYLTMAIFSLHCIRLPSPRHSRLQTRTKQLFRERS